MDSAALLGAIGFAVAMSASPGPNNTLAAAIAARFGWRATIPFVLGVAVGFPAMLVLVALGAAPVLDAVPRLEATLRWVGAAWLLWLAWRLLRASHGGDAAAPARPLRGIEAAAFQWVNPKAWMIAAGAVALYGGRLEDAAVLGAIFAVAAAASVGVWAGLGALAAARLAAHPVALRRCNQAMAGLLAASAVLPLLE